MTRPIVLIHGLWMTPRSWEGWIERFGARGFEVHAPSWPGMEAPVEELQRDTSAYARLKFGTIVDRYETFVRGLAEPPIIMGHSFGGAVTQVLVDRGLGCAAVPICPAPVRGIPDLPLATIKTAFPILKSPLNWNRAVALNAKQFHFSFGNHTTLEESEKIRAAQAIPGPGGVLWQGALANMNPKTPLKVDFERDRAPMLFLGGGIDNVVPGKVVAKLARKHGASPSKTEFRMYEDRSHHIAGQAGWEEVADHALEWAVANAR